jgi:hypothetical protein
MIKTIKANIIRGLKNVKGDAPDAFNTSVSESDASLLNAIMEASNIDVGIDIIRKDGKKKVIVSKIKIKGIFLVKIRSAKFINLSRSNKKTKRTFPSRKYGINSINIYFSATFIYGYQLYKVL